jgi:hypothetical protein
MELTTYYIGVDTPNREVFMYYYITRIVLIAS